MKTFNRNYALLCILLTAVFASPQDTSPLSAKINELAEKIASNFPAAQADSARHRIAVMEFDNIGNLAKRKEVGRIVSEMLCSDLAHHTDKFEIVERSQLEKVLKELALAQTGLLDSKSAQEAGKMAGANAIVSGSVSEAGKFFIVNARMIDVALGTVIISESVELEQAGMIALSDKRIVVKKYPIDAAFRSMIVPGWGQFYNDHPSRGYLYAAAVVIEAGGIIGFKVMGDAKHKKYQQNTADAVQYFDMAKDNYRIRDYFVYAAIGTWLINVLDAYIGAANDLRHAKEGALLTRDNHLGLSLVPGVRATGIALNMEF
jgi:TolB-like protein